MNKISSSDTNDCLEQVEKEIKNEHESEFKFYFKSLEIFDKRDLNRAETEALAIKAKNGWDSFVKYGCLAQSSVKSKDNPAYKAHSQFMSHKKLYLTNSVL